MEQAADKLPIDQLAQLEYDKSVLFFGVVPLVAIAVLAIVGGVLYYLRRSKNWHELGDAMRIDDGDTPVAKDAEADFASRHMADMDPTKPSQRLTRVSRPD